MSQGNRAFVERFLYEMWYIHVFDMDAIGDQDMIREAISELPDDRLEDELLSFIESF